MLDTEGDSTAALLGTTYFTSDYAYTSDEQTNIRAPRTEDKLELLIYFDVTGPLVTASMLTTKRRPPTLSIHFIRLMRQA